MYFNFNFNRMNEVVAAKYKHAVSIDAIYFKEKSVFFLFFLKKTRVYSASAMLV